MQAVFISYRRKDTEGYSGRLHDALVRHFGADSVFMDVVDIAAGRDFREVIDDSLESSAVLLVVIGENWVDARDEAGLRRLENPVDFVRLEIAAALKQKIPVVPVLVQGALMPTGEKLPDDLKELAHRNAVELRHAHWDSDVERLIKSLLPLLTKASEVPDIFEYLATLPDAGPFDINGVWDCDDGGSYYIRNLGQEAWWFGHGVRPGQSFANVAYGKIEGEGDIRTLKVRWVDVPAGTTNGWGRLILQFSISKQLNRVVEMSAIEKSGHFGGSYWTWRAPWGDQLRLQSLNSNAESQER